MKIDRRNHINHCEKEETNQNGNRFPSEKVSVENGRKADGISEAVQQVQKESGNHKFHYFVLKEFRNFI